MYELNNSVRVDVATEINAMAAYISERWDNVPEIHDLFLRVAQAALHVARAWINQYAITSAVMGLYARRKQLLENLDLEGSDILPYYDAPCSLFLQMQTSVEQLYEEGMTIDGEWYFSRNVFAVFRTLLAEYPTLPKARPKGWAALAKNYSDMDGMHEYCETRQFADEKAFQGANTSGEGAAGFTGRTALPYVMYDEKCQGRKAHWVLVSAGYAHFLAIAQHMNTQAMLESIKTTDWRDREPNAVWELDAAPENPLLKSLVQMAKARQDSFGSQPAKQAFEDALKARREFNAKSPEEQAAIREESQRNLLEIIKNFKLAD